MSGGSRDTAELAIVIPVYNEAACIRDVLCSWRAVLAQLNVNYHFVIVNDGSTDATAAILDEFTRDPQFKIISQTNAGHGPALLTGYHHAVQVAPWIFQTDGDEEMNPRDFPALWRARNEVDAAFGVRQREKQNFARRLISGISQRIVRALFGSAVHDVNVPFRLIRREVLAPILPQIPRDVFAPNVMISGALSRANFRVLNHPLKNQPRRTDRSLTRELVVIFGSAKAAWEVLRFAMRRS